MTKKATAGNVPCKRMIELDLARSLPILGLPFVHCYEELETDGLLAAGTTSWGQIFLYLCALGPSIFMILLGINLTLSSHGTPEELAKRGVKTIFYFYLLNIFRGLLPSFLLEVTGVKGMLSDGILYTLASDILFFAGASFLFFALMKKLNISPLTILAFSIVLLTADMLIPSVEISSDYLAAFLGNFFYVNEDSCFPFLSWAIFPSIGYLAGGYIQKLKTEEEKSRFYGYMLLLSAVSLAALCVCMSQYHLDWLLIAASPANDYITDLFNVLITVLIAGIWLGLFYFLCRQIHSITVQNIIVRISSSIMTFYCIQWLIVGWMWFLMIELFGLDSHHFHTVSFVILSLVVFALTMTITMFLQSRKEKKKIGA